jgi:hypothetical protein
MAAQRNFVVANRKLNFLTSDRNHGGVLDLRSDVLLGLFRCPWSFITSISLQSREVKRVYVLFLTVYDKGFIGIVFHISI